MHKSAVQLVTYINADPMVLAMRGYLYFYTVTCRLTVNDKVRAIDSETPNSNRASIGELPNKCMSFPD